jgi:6-phosphofructokinase 1
VVGAPKTIDGDLKCPPYIPVSFGFDTACKTYATLVGNVATDALSAQKYYHLVRLMGRSASNIALEVALITRPNACLLGEEVAHKKQSLRDITLDLADMIEERSNEGKDYGVIVLPEGLIEFIPEFNSLITEINDKLAAPGVEATEAGVLSVLSETNAASFKYLPGFIREQLLLDRDPHGNVQVAKIETEKLLAATISAELEVRRGKGTYKGKFQTQFHSYGYEGRAGMPTVFDASYCYALGCTAASLLSFGMTGLIASVKNLLKPVKEWECGGVPITSLCVIERRKGKDKPVIRKALVELDGPLSQPFDAWSKIRGDLRRVDAYSCPGPIQYDMKGCPMSTEIPVSLQLELGQPLAPLCRNQAPKRMGDFLFIPQSKRSRSGMQQWRLERSYCLPEVLANYKLSALQVTEGEKIQTLHDKDVLQEHFACIDKPVIEISPGKGGAPATSPSIVVGVAFSGRQAPGCHDLICGLVDMVASAGGSGKVFGFVGGTKGLFGGHAVELTQEMVTAYRGTGGLELLGRTVDSLSSETHKEQARQTCEKLGLTGLVLVGGNRTHTDAAYLAEHFRQKGSKTAIVGVPCGIEGSMVNEFVEASIGFDSASKAMASLVGNTAIDGSSARKYYYFLKLMDGSSHGSKVATSHVALEAALQSKPNLLLLTEEIDHTRMSLREVVQQVADVVAQRAKAGKNFGTIIVAEGMLSGIPECRTLLSELEALPGPIDREKLLPQLTQWSRAVFNSFPDFLQKQLLLERQSNASIQLSQLETDRLIAGLVEDELKQRKKMGTFVGSFSPVCEFLGYQARCSMPSNFDMDYAYTVGGTAARLVAGGHSGYMAVVSDLSKPNSEWRLGGVPLTAMLSVPPQLPNEATRARPAIDPSPVDLEGAAFAAWVHARSKFAQEELYENPGPIQFSGPSASCVSLTVRTKFPYLHELANLQASLAAVATKCQPGCDPRKVRVAAQSLATLNAILEELTGPLEANLQR